jgi:uncharacterized protein
MVRRTAGETLPVETQILMAVAGVYLLAGFVKGMIGFGLPTVAIGLLGLMMMPAQVAAIVVIPSLVTNIWQSVAGPGFGRLLRRLWSMLAGICLSVWVSAGLLTGVHSGLARTALGGALVVYALLGLCKVRFFVPPKAEAWVTPLVGLATGLVVGATGIFTLPAVPYLQSLRLDQDDLVQALGLSFTVSTLALAGVLIHSGAVHVSDASLSLLALVVALIGMRLGQTVRHRAKPEIFRFCLFLGLLVLGTYLALRGVLD